MTEQYQQNNINVPRKTQVFNSTGLLNIVSLDLDSDLVIAETDTAGVLLQLPTADQIPAQQIAIKTPDAGTTGNPVTIIPQPGELIDGLASVSLTADQEAIILKAAGDSQGAGYYWQIVASNGGGGGATAPSVDLLSTAPGDFTVDNIISFDAWASLLAALALLPNDGGLPTLFQPSRIWAGFGSDFGWFDSSIGRASIEGVSVGTFGQASLFNSAVTINDVRSLKNLNVTFGVVPLPGFARFTPGSDAEEIAYLLVENCTFSAPVNGGAASSAIGMNGVLESHGQSFYSVDSIFVGGPFGTLNFEAYDRCVVEDGAFTSPGAGTVICDILDPSANVGIIHPGLGLFDLQLGTSPAAAGGSFGTTYGNAGEMIFGGLVVFGPGAPSQELRAGDNGNLGNAAIPIAGAPGIPFVGMTITRPGYIRGIGVVVDDPSLGFDTFSVEVYVGGVLAFTETGFDTVTSGYQYFDTGFTRIGPTVPPFGGSIEIVIVPLPGGAGLPHGISVFPRFV